MDISVNAFSVYLVWKANKEEKWENVLGEPQREPQNIMGLKVRKKRMKDQFKDNINVDNNESKVKKKKRN